MPAREIIPIKRMKARCKAAEEAPTRFELVYEALQASA